MRATRLTGALMALGLGAPLAWAPPAAATTMFPEEFTCPVGGEEFEDYVIGSSSSWGQRPDGRPYGTLPVYPLVECPGNGFPIFQEEFTPKEIAALTPLVESAAFQAMRASETSYYRLWWLLEQTGRPPAARANALLVASWESDDDPERKARYQAAFVAAAAAVPREEEAWFYYGLRAANALRELGRFAEAAALLDEVTGSGNAPSEAEEADAVQEFVAGLGALVSEGNPHPEPANLIPPMIAAERCAAEDAGLSASEAAACASPEYQEAIAARAEYALGEGEDSAAAAVAAAEAAIAGEDFADAAMADAEANAEAAGDAIEAAVADLADGEDWEACGEEPAVADDEAVACAEAIVEPE